MPKVQPTPKATMIFPRISKASLNSSLATLRCFLPTTHCLPLSGSSSPSDPWASHVELAGF